MRLPQAIPVYREINEWHEALELPVRSDLPDFHLFTLEDTYPVKLQAVPPHRRGFFLLTHLASSGGGTIQLEDVVLTGVGNTLVFSPPEQVLSWTRGCLERGYVLCLKPSLFCEEDPAVEFPFFEPAAANVMSPGEADRVSLLRQLETLHGVFHSRHPYRRQRLAALTTTLLYDCRAWLERANGRPASSSRVPGVISRFRRRVSECFDDACSVRTYARHLHVSADHLGALLRKHRGRTARDLTRVLREAMRLLAHTEMTASEIAARLNFAEPTHFSRFFKRHTGRTPLAYRRSARLAPPDARTPDEAA